MWSSGTPSRRPKGQGPRDKGQGPRDKGQGPRPKGQGPRDKGQGPRDKGQGPAFEARELALEPGVVHVWTVPLDGECDIEAYRRLLQPAELERAGRFVTPDLQRRFIVCRGALRRILGDYVQCAPEAVEFETGPYGKPTLGGGHSSVSFNLSHSGELAVVAVTSGQAVGIDIEQVREVADADAIAGRFFSPGEYDQYRQLAAADRARGFFRCWTRKEAFIKATGEGLSRPLSSFDVTLLPDEPARLIRIQSDADEAAAWSLHGFAPLDGYEAAVAIRRQNARIVASARSVRS